MSQQKPTTTVSNKYSEDAAGHWDILQNNNNNNDRLTAFDPGQPG